MTTMNNAQRIRFGGQQTPDGFLFELTGGDPALDLANTLVNRTGPEPEELLGDYDALVNWAAQMKLVDAPAALRRDARRNPVAAARVLRRAIELRETIFAIFANGDVDAETLRKLELFTRQAARHRRLVGGRASRLPGGRDARPPLTVSWQWERGGLDQMLWPVAEAAAALLTSERRERVRVCARNPPCRWLFVDDSRRGNRRWCDMSVCGNRAKARRHYEKVKGLP